MRVMIMSCMLILGGCATIPEQQVAWEAMTPAQQMIELERRRVAIEQQRANTEQIEAGLRMMQGAQPTFAPPPRPTACSTYQSAGTLQTVCN